MRDFTILLDLRSVAQAVKEPAAMKRVFPRTKTLLERIVPMLWSVLFLSTTESWLICSRSPFLWRSHFPPITLCRQPMKR
ncbi:hypothetical protein NC969_02820 [Leptolyngbya subtilissima ST-M1]